MYPALRKAKTSDRTFSSAMRRVTALWIPLCGMYRSNRRGHLRLSMRHAGTSGLHLVVPCVGYVPWRNPCEHGKKSASKNWLQDHTKALLDYPYLRVKGCLMVAAYRYSLGYYVRRTAFGRYVPLRSLSQSRWIRGRSMSSAVSVSIPGV